HRTARGGTRGAVRLGEPGGGGEGLPGAGVRQQGGRGSVDVHDVPGRVQDDDGEGGGRRAVGRGRGAGAEVVGERGHEPAGGVRPFTFPSSDAWLCHLSSPRGARASGPPPGRLRGRDPGATRIHAAAGGNRLGWTREGGRVRACSTSTRTGSGEAAARS